MEKTYTHVFAGLTLFLLAACSSQNTLNDTQLVEKDTPGPVNIVLIVADDLGYGDLGAYGGEIETPNIDRLAEQGLMFSRFYAGPMCSPTRSMLLTGVDMHLNGLGTMREFPGEIRNAHSGYLGVLNHQVDTLADILGRRGYHTSIAGKWHLGPEDHRVPTARGFDRSFALMDGAANHFTNGGSHPDWPEADYRSDGVKAGVPEDFYSTTHFTDKALDFIAEARSSDQPFFAYIAYTAPHWPLQAPRESIERQNGRYDAGWDIVRAKRFERMKSSGLIEKDLALSPRWARVPEWSSLSEQDQKFEARLMEVYAAMVSDMDREIGRLLSELEAIEALDNTIVVFMSDNGADAGDFVRNHPRHLAWQEEMGFRKSLEDLGSELSFQAYHAGWAQVGSVHLNLHKSHATEGGLRSPLIIRDFRDLADGAKIDVPFTSVDLAETILDWASADDPSLSDPTKLDRQGTALSDLLDYENSGERHLAFEFAGGRGLSRGNWKLVSVSPFFQGDGQWRLYDLARDPGELSDLSTEYPDVFASMIADYEAQAEANKIIEFIVETP